MSDFTVATGTFENVLICSVQSCLRSYTCDSSVLWMA